MSFYWYENRPNLLIAEQETMQAYFRAFQLLKMGDGRLYWHGKVRPSGSAGSDWEIMLVYDHNHPHNNTYGGSIKAYCSSPELDVINKLVSRFHSQYAADSAAAYASYLALLEYMGIPRSCMSTRSQNKFFHNLGEHRGWFIPHVLTDNFGNKYLCTARPSDLLDGIKEVSTAATALGFVLTWVYAFERFILGEVGSEIYGETY